MADADPEVDARHRLDEPATTRLVLLATSHRVAPGLLSRAAWQLLGTGDVVVGSADHPLARVLADEGVPVTVVEGSSTTQAARTLLDRALAASRPVVWLIGDDGDPGLAESLAPLMAGAADQGRSLELEVVHGSFDLPGARLLDLVSVMDRLRSPGGCPWDAEQTHRSLAPYLLEETYETLEAIESDDVDAVREELGDVLLQVVFHARLGEEDPDRPWSIDDVAAAIIAKLVRRHPHVFVTPQADVDGSAGGAALQPQVLTAEHVEASWEVLKATEKGRTSVLDGVPMTLPALALAAKLVGRAARTDLAVEVAEPDLPEDLSAEQLGLLLLGVASAALRRGLDAEAALREAARGFAGLVRMAESDRTG
ncbi:MAG: MazG family protein [Actinomycetes bacterium]